MMKTNRQYKDRFFRYLFGNNEWKEHTLELYNALNGTGYRDPNALKLMTIENVIYLEMKNDLSFIIDDELNLYEQQSSYNPNMPIRGLMYFARQYETYIETNELNIYGTKQLTLPTPRYVVFYNGKSQPCKRTTLRLTDSFPEKSRDSGDIELTATMINVNREAGDELLEKCRTLQDYSTFIQKIRMKITEGLSADIAIDMAVDECIKEGVLSNIFRKHKSEVISMILTEYNEERVRKADRTEGYEAGIAEGIEKGIEKGIHLNKRETALKLLKKGMSPLQIAEITDLQESEIAGLMYEQSKSK